MCVAARCSRRAASATENVSHTTSCMRSSFEATCALACCSCSSTVACVCCFCASAAACARCTSASAAARTSSKRTSAAARASRASASAAARASSARRRRRPSSKASRSASLRRASSASSLADVSAVNSSAVRRCAISSVLRSSSLSRPATTCRQWHRAASAEPHTARENTPITLPAPSMSCRVFARSIMASRSELARKRASSFSAIASRALVTSATKAATAIVNPAAGLQHSQRSVYRRGSKQTLTLTVHKRRPSTCQRNQTRLA